jgi:inner membrane transporter RhtA
MRSTRNLQGAIAQAATEVSINFGSSMAALAIPLVGTVVVVAVRQLLILVVVVPFARPRPFRHSWAALWPALALGLVLVVMNLSFYESVHRLGLGTAATIEFLGPLSIAIFASRRLIDVACAIAAAAGVVLLTSGDGRIEPVGVILALIAAASWAGYILLTRRVAVELPGLQGIGVASMVASIILVPIALVVVPWSALDLRVTGLLLATGVLSSALPYTLDTFILRRISTRLYAIITSMGPAIAAVFGWLILNEQFALRQQLAIALVCIAAGVAVATQRTRSGAAEERAAEAMP